MPLVYNTGLPPPRESPERNLESTATTTITASTHPSGQQLRNQSILSNRTEPTLNANNNDKMINQPAATNLPAVTRAELIERIKAGESTTWSSRNKNDLRLQFTQKLSHDDKPVNENERPYSALHSGVFSPDNSRVSNHPPSPINPFFNPPFANARHTNLSSSPPSPLAPPQAPFHSESSTPARGRPRTQSVSSLSNYVLKPPTSPLVHSTNPDQDTSTGANPIDISTPSRNFARRPSLVPSSTLSSFQLSPSYPRQPTHVARKSITDNWYDSSPVAPTHSRQQSRRLSVGFGPGGGDLPFGSFVGSYEESILSGRMSTTPSKPLNFVAKIGVLGLGKCKAALRCPTHVTIPFPAYFYSVGDYDSPSPYVGQIDLEAALAEKSKSSKGFPDGGYRIPQKGQVQIVIKNPNNTAVKLFLIPYDLKDMEPGTKTFIRQKSYAADLIKEFRQTNPSTCPPTPGTAKKQLDKEREALRYMIHLHICSPAKGRFYLHRAIRVVFANRVPDGKEKLRNELHQPEPKYSPWKSGKAATSSTGVPAPEDNGVVATPTRRRRASSLMFSFAADGIVVPPHLPSKAVPDVAPQNDFIVADEKRHPDAYSPTCSSSSFGSSDGAGPGAGGYDKLSSSLYSSTSGRSEAGQGLLTKKLKNLDVKQTNITPDEDGDMPMVDAPLP